MHVATRPRHPIIFELPPASFQRARKHRPAMLVPPELSALFHPQNIRKRAAAHVESKMPDVHVLDKRDVRRFVLARADLLVRPPKLANHPHNFVFDVDRHGPSLESRDARTEICRRVRSSAFNHRNASLRFKVWRNKFADRRDKSRSPSRNSSRPRRDQRPAPPNPHPSSPQPARVSCFP